MLFEFFVGRHVYAVDMGDFVDELGSFLSGEDFGLVGETIRGGDAYRGVLVG